MATLVELGPDDVLIVRLDRDADAYDDHIDFLGQVSERFGIRAVLVMPTDATLSSLPVDEVLRAVAGP